MAAINNEDNVVDVLRQRTEKEELKQYLKSTLGGYTKKSVLEYLALLQKQQQAAAATFNRNMQQLLSEKESLQKENEKAVSDLAYKEFEFSRLSETREARHLEELEALRAENGSQQKLNLDMKSSVDAMRREYSEMEADLAEARQEAKTQADLLAAEKQETDRQRELVSQYAAWLEELQKELSYLKEFSSEDKIAELNEEIGKLASANALYESVNSQLKERLDFKDKEIEVYAEENDAVRQSVESISAALDKLAVQNEKLVLSNKELANALEDESRKAIRIMREKSDETVEKLILRRKLDDMTSKLSYMELCAKRPCGPETQLVLGPELVGAVSGGCDAP